MTLRAVAIATCLAVLVLLAVQTPAEVVTLRDGRTFTGKVTKKGDTVVIEMKIGTVEVKAADVLYTTPEPPAATTSEPTLTTKLLPDTPGAPSPTPSATPAASQPAPADMVRPLAMGDIGRPEAQAFAALRVLAGTPAGSEYAESTKQLERWRIMVHDRKRKLGADWIGPEDISRHRKAFIDTMKEADALFKKVHGGSVYGRPASVDPRELAPGRAKMRQAAQTWADPLLRFYLSGIVEYQSSNPVVAHTCFESCCKFAPCVAGFFQADALALIELKRGTDATAAAIQAVRLQPDTDTLHLLKLCMQKTPGAETKSETYQTAEKLLAAYGDVDDKSVASTDNTWLMPDKSNNKWRSRDETLPLPPYDSLVFRQCVGVPVGRNALLVDASVVKDAYKTYVCVDGRAVPATAQKPPTNKKGDVGLAVLIVDGYEFTPAEVDKLGLQADQSYTFSGVGVYQEMGTEVRSGSGKLGQPVAGVDVMVPGLLAGEPAGPVLSDKGKLVGFLAGKTDPMADGGGPDKVIPAGDLQPLLDQAKKPTSGGSYYYGSAKPKKSPATQPAEGKVFLVTVISGELVDDEKH